MDTRTTSAQRPGNIADLILRQHKSGVAPLGDVGPDELRTWIAAVSDLLVAAGSASGCTHQCANVTFPDAAALIYVLNDTLKAFDEWAPDLWGYEKAPAAVAQEG